MHGMYLPYYRLCKLVPCAYLFPVHPLPYTIYHMYTLYHNYILATRIVVTRGSVKYFSKV